ncbi:MAG TPA: GNAT family N-acetyltransferase [Tepidisphaeraceae bacterium]|jgi:ribosomal protein S18 acetylase RimI-like enzyme
MSLPILNIPHQPSREDLIRFFHRTELHWVRHLAEETALESGTAFANPAFPGVHDANNLRDAVLPEGWSGHQAMDEVDAFYAAQGTRCAYWVMNPSAPAEQTAPLAEHLLQRHFTTDIAEIMRLARTPYAARAPATEVPGLKIIPARSSFRHARQLAEGSAQRWNCPELADATMLHLDDPHWDALIALKDGQAIAHVGVLAVGDIGRIENLWVAPEMRGLGIGRTMMGRALEICARSLFHHVFLNVLPGNSAAIALYQHMGFDKIGEITYYRSPA